MKEGEMNNPPREPRQFLGINFECCSIYARIYKTADGKKYSGSCPKCRRKIEVMVGEGGSSGRFFSAR